MTNFQPELRHSVPDGRLGEFISGMPKAELHVHVEGALEPELMLELARRNQVDLPYASVEEIRRAGDCADLRSFLDFYYDNARVLCDEQDFYDLAWNYLLRAKADNVVHAEMFCDPQLHLARGVPIGDVIRGVGRAAQDAEIHLDMSASLILCFLREPDEEKAFDMLEAALPWREYFIGVGLDANECGHPPERFRALFARCRAEELHIVAHAGMEGPPEYIRQAVEVLGAERIDHGIRCLENAQLVELLRRQQIPLTVCPLANVRLHQVPALEQHCLADLWRAGLKVTVNSDHPAYYGGYINDNFIRSFAALDLEAGAVVEMVANSFAASFAPAPQKAGMLGSLQGYLDTFE